MQIEKCKLQIDNLSMQADVETQARYDELADKRTEGQLTAEEEEELAAMVRANTLVGLLKAEARVSFKHDELSGHFD